jgi:hypothetical protein
MLEAQGLDATAAAGEGEEGEEKPPESSAKAAFAGKWIIKWIIWKPPGSSAKAAFAGKWIFRWKWRRGTAVSDSSARAAFAGKWIFRGKWSRGSEGGEAITRKWTEY